MVTKKPSGTFLIRYKRMSNGKVINDSGGFINIRAKTLKDVKKYSKDKKVKIISAKKNYL